MGRIAELNSLDTVAKKDKHYYGDLREWAMYKDENEKWYIICNSDWYAINNNKIEFIKRLKYNNMIWKYSEEFNDNQYKE